MKWCATSVRPNTVPIGQMCQPNCNDQIAARAFGATIHISPLEFDLLCQYDAIFATMWKVKESFEPRWMDVLHRLKDAGKTVVLFQEAETGWPMTRSWDEINSFVELLKKVDLFLTHNQRDVEFWGVLAKRALRWRTCIDIEAIERRRWVTTLKTAKPILFGSSYDGRANGLAGLISCRTLGNPLWHQNRSTGYADRNKDLPAVLGIQIDKEIPHSGWDQWLSEIAGAYIAVHMMPAAAAGRDQIAFAALGIPCIGNPELDIQRELFPYLSIPDLYDPFLIRQGVMDLLANSDFYSECRDRALFKVSEYGIPASYVQARMIKEKAGLS